MKHAQPRGLNRRRVQKLLSGARKVHSAGGRIDLLSRRFVGRRYEQNPLIGSADVVEVFVTSLDRFDCVTYIETVLALSRASSVAGFSEWLRKIRYERGHVQWGRRNHYMTDWIRNNTRNETLRSVSNPALPSVRKERVLNVVPGLPAKRVRMKCVPKAAVSRLEPILQIGDLIFFVSTRRNLDVFHAGIVVRNGQRILMRHASRSQGGVVEQELREFLRTNRMAGVIVARSREV